MTPMRAYREVRCEALINVQRGLPSVGVANDHWMVIGRVGVPLFEFNAVLSQILFAVMKRAL